MCQLFETLCVKNGIFLNVEEHTQRMNNALAEVPTLILPNLANIVIPSNYKGGIVRCRIDYSSRSQPQISYYPYQQRIISSLKLVEADDVDYHLKFSDRKAIEKLVGFRQNADEILIVKKGLITDTSYTNVVLFDGQHYVTPIQPLLKGTQRAFLLKTGRIKESEICVSDLSNFHSVYLINAMMPLGDCPVVSVTNVF